MNVKMRVEDPRATNPSTHILLLIVVISIGTDTRALVRCRIEHKTIRARRAIVLRWSCASATQSIAGKALLRVLIVTTRACCEALAIQQQ